MGALHSPWTLTWHILPADGGLAVRPTGRRRDPSSGSRNDPTVTQGEAGAQEGADRGGLFRRPLLHRADSDPGAPRRERMRLAD